MQLVNLEITSFDNLASDLTKLNNAIKTSYLPVGFTDVKSFITAVVDSNFNRKFGGCGTSADIQLDIKDNSFTFFYSSTSGTEVLVNCKLDDDFETIYECNLQVKLPDSRIGGYHYENITQAFYQYTWLGNKPKEFPTPNWLTSLTAFRKVWRNDNARIKLLAKLKAVETQFSNIWELPNHYLIKFGYSYDDTFDLISKDKKLEINPDPNPNNVRTLLDMLKQIAQYNLFENEEKGYEIEQEDETEYEMDEYMFADEILDE